MAAAFVCDLRGEQRVWQLVEEVLQGQPGLGGVCLDCRSADAGLRCELGHHGGEGDVQAGTLCFVLGVHGDEPLGCLCAGVAAAER
jgi:hypothetical protein